MTRLFLCGISGKMGRAIVDLASSRDGFTVVGGLVIVPHPAIRTYTRAADVACDFDVLVDFSRPELLPEIIALCSDRNKPAVLASTGYTDDELALIDALSHKVAVLRSGNMSVGVNLLMELVERAAAALGAGFDIEIIEKHHNQKADAPSGTALMLAEAVGKAKADMRLRYGRQGKDKRKAEEVTIHAVRGGTIVGEHDVIFAGDDEIVTLSHTALSRKIFASGALRAAEFIAARPAGLYSMRDAL